MSFLSRVGTFLGNVGKKALITLPFSLGGRALGAGLDYAVGKKISRSKPLQVLSILGQVGTTIASFIFPEFAIPLAFLGGALGGFTMDKGGDNAPPNEGPPIVEAKPTPLNYTALRERGFMANTLNKRVPNPDPGALRSTNLRESNGSDLRAFNTNYLK